MSAVNSSKFVVPEEYWHQYKRARVTFRHHIIYNPQTEVNGCWVVIFVRATFGALLLAYFQISNLVNNAMLLRC